MLVQSAKPLLELQAERWLYLCVVSKNSGMGKKRHTVVWCTECRAELEVSSRRFGYSVVNKTGKRMRGKWLEGQISFTNGAMSVKGEICPLGFRQLGGTVREAWYGRQHRFPHEERRPVHQQTPKSLRRTRHMKEVERVEMTEYLLFRIYISYAPTI
jgi:hypothetical protein